MANIDALVDNGSMVWAGRPAGKSVKDLRDWQGNVPSRMMACMDCK